MERRKFIKSTCTLCVSAVAFDLLLSSCGTSSKIFRAQEESGKINIPLTEFMDKNHLVIRTNSLLYDVFVYKKPNGEFTALSMKCSHRDSSVQYTSGGLTCNEHGSRFSFEGEVTKEPATEPLTKYPVTTNETHLIINIKKS